MDERDAYEDSCLVAIRGALNLVEDDTDGGSIVSGGRRVTDVRISRDLASSTLEVTWVRADGSAGEETFELLTDAAGNRMSPTALAAIVVTNLEEP
jgi:hypothetical protein